MRFTRKTLADTVEIEGIGLHFGEPVTVKLHPGESGIAFRYGAERVEAKAQNISDTSSCTRLGGVSTIEHLMSAFAGAEITDVEVELSAPEAPALDGSSRDWIQAIDSVGLASIGERELVGPFTRIFKHVEGKLEKIALAAGTGHWRYVFHSPSKYPFDQSFETQNVVEDYREHIAPARTFGWDEDRAGVEAMGFAQGLYESDESREGNVLILGETASLGAMRFPDEPTRHKLLDAIGDLYLAGVPIRALNFVGEGSGHRLNIEAAAHLAAVVQFVD